MLDLAAVHGATLNPYWAEVGALCSLASTCKINDCEPLSIFAIVGQVNSGFSRAPTNNEGLPFLHHYAPLVWVLHLYVASPDGTFWATEPLTEKKCSGPEQTRGAGKAKRHNST